MQNDNYRLRFVAFSMQQLIATRCLAICVARRNDVNSMPTGAMAIGDGGNLILWPDSTTEFRGHYAHYGGERA